MSHCDRFQYPIPHLASSAANMRSGRESAPEKCLAVGWAAQVIVKNISIPDLSSGTTVQSGGRLPGENV